MDAVRTVSTGSELSTGPRVAHISDRDTDELIIGLVGPVSSGASTTTEQIKKILENRFSYEVIPIKVSSLIPDIAREQGKSLPSYKDELDRVERLQKVGSKLRENFGGQYLAEKCVEKIATHRFNNDGFQNVDGVNVPLPKRRAYIIDSLKHPEEVKLLSDVYRDLFWVFGVFAPESVRRRRLVEKGIPDNLVRKIIEIDEEEGVSHGQRVRDTIQAADFFIRNDKDNQDELGNSIARYLNIIFATDVITPKLDEVAMYNAAAAAAGSACLSRQVGAAIYSKEGELIGKGRNDVPKAFGGLYSADNKKDDHRCYKWRQKECHNDLRKKKLYVDIYSELNERGLLRKGKGIDYEAIEAALKSTDIKNLIEYSRAVHAEMDAIISVARANKYGILGSTLYCTTFPCHNCARHIVASGVSRVIYIEPYPKSLAITLHSDAVSTSSSEKKVAFLQYEGVAPKNMLSLFGYRASRKANGKAVQIKPAIAKPISRSPLDGFHRREQIIVHRLTEAEKTRQ